MTESTPKDKNDFQYWAFISYSHRDEKFCGWLHKKLDSYKTPSSLVGETANDGIHTVPAKLYPIFRDREELPAGANLSDAITAALRDSRYLVVICSPHSAASKWVNQEIEYFISLGREKYIFPIILEGEPNSTDPQKPECFQPALRTPKEPLAADARKGKDGRDAALMKLRAGLLGVGLEDLVNRELKRQKKKVMLYALLAVFMLLLVVFSWFKQQEADEAKNLAFIAEKNAEHNYGLALAEKADRAFSENKVNEGQIYSAHALARIDGARDKDAEETRFSIFSSHLGKPGIPVTIRRATEADNYFKDANLSPNGKIRASLDKDNSKIIHLLDVATGQSIATLSGHTESVISVHFSPDGKTLASGSEDKTVRLWDVATGKAIATLSGHERSVNSVHFSPDGKTLASGSWDETVRLWDVSSRNLPSPIKIMGGEKNLSPNGKILASIDKDNFKIIHLLDAATGKAIATLSGHTDWVWSVHFSPDGKTLASGSGDKTVWLWDVSSRNSPSPIKIMGGEKNLSPNGKILASIDKDNSKIIHLLDVATGKAIATFEGHTNDVESVHFSPDGKTLASGSLDNTVRLWDVATGKAIATLSGHTEPVLSVHFSPDGKTLASGSGDETVRLWDILIATLSGHTNYVSSVHFSPDGKTLISRDRKGNIKQWSLDDLSVRDWAAQAAKDERRYGLKLEGMKLVPIQPDEK